MSAPEADQSGGQVLRADDGTLHRDPGRLHDWAKRHEE